jgi:hypothetical protein
MLYSAMPTLPVSDLRNKQAEIVKQLDETPILLTRVAMVPASWCILRSGIN